MESYSDIELTPEEIAEVLRKARGVKAATIKEAQYWEKVKTPPPPPPKFTAKQLDQYIKANHPHFLIDDNNREIYTSLIYYFTNDPKAEDYGLLPHKGIMLYGPIGCGKTELMRVFSKNTYRPFLINPVRKITDAYADKKGGVLALKEYSTMQEVYPHLNLGIGVCGRCYDDLGTEENKKNYGNDLNVMQDILYKIYDDRLMGNFHLTTNLSGDEIEAFYGKRIRSRMREMFNVLEFENNTPDRRK